MGGGAREACGESQKQGVRVEAIKIKTSGVKTPQARSEHIKNRTGVEPQQREHKTAVHCVTVSTSNMRVIRGLSMNMERRTHVFQQIQMFVGALDHWSDDP